MITIDETLFDQLTAQAKNSPRLRSHWLLHKTPEDPIHRLVMAAEPGTYVRPHRHMTGSKWELFGVLRGRLVCFVFDDAGNVLHRTELGGAVKFIQLEPDQWHSFVSLESGSIAFEVKPGPYVKPDGSDAASWAPAEGAPGAAELESRLRNGALLP